ncbi:unnamed protein product, partial [Oppiella nova]
MTTKTSNIGTHYPKHIHIRRVVRRIGFKKTETKPQEMAKRVHKVVETETEDQFVDTSRDNRVNCESIGVEPNETISGAKGKRFRPKQLLTEHHLRHRQLRQYQCDECDSAFVTKNGLKGHKQYRHSDERPYGCDWPGCDSAFKGRQQLALHKACHLNERVFVCDIDDCMKSFVTKKMLTSHRLQHLKPIVCSWPACGQRFAQNFMLTEHMNRHQDLRPFSFRLERQKSDMYSLTDLSKIIDVLHIALFIYPFEPNIFGIEFGDAGFIGSRFIGSTEGDVIISSTSLVILSDTFQFKDKTQLFDQFFAGIYLLFCTILLSIYSGSLYENIIRGQEFDWVEKREDLFTKSHWKHATIVPFDQTMIYYLISERQTGSQMGADLFNRLQPTDPLSVMTNTSEQNQLVFDVMRNKCGGKTVGYYLLRSFMERNSNYKDRYVEDRDFYVSPNENTSTLYKWLLNEDVLDEAFIYKFNKIVARLQSSGVYEYEVRKSLKPKGFGPDIHEKPKTEDDMRERVQHIINVCGYLVDRSEECLHFNITGLQQEGLGQNLHYLKGIKSELSAIPVTSVGQQYMHQIEVDVNSTTIFIDNICHNINITFH